MCGRRFSVAPLLRVAKVGFYEVKHKSNLLSSIDRRGVVALRLDFDLGGGKRGHLVPMSDALVTRVVSRTPASKSHATRDLTGSGATKEKSLRELVDREVRKKKKSSYYRIKCPSAKAPSKISTLAATPRERAKSLRNLIEALK